MINESCHLSSKVEIMVSICWIAPYKYRNRLWFGAVLRISAVSATFFCSFPDFWRGLGCCFGDFCGFSYFFLLFSGFFGGVWGAVLGISAVSATFFCSFPDFWRGLGCCFGNFCGFSSTRPACYAINLWLLYIMII